MKKILLSLMIPLIFSLSSRSQSLLNTTWAWFTPPATFSGYFHFGVDTLYFSVNNITYFPLQKYFESGNVFTIIDYAATSCTATDTGRYNFTIQNDTLDFTLISDVCASRVGLIDPDYGVAVPTGIAIQQSAQGIQVSPNPSGNGIFNLVVSPFQNEFDRISVSTVEGKVVLDKALTDHALTDHIIDLSKFPAGVYVLMLYSNKNMAAVKLLK